MTDGGWTDGDPAGSDGDPGRRDGDPVLRRTLAAAGLPLTGRFVAKAGWVSRAWVGEEYVVRVNNGHFRDAYRHEAAVVELLAGSAVPHARHLAHGNGPDGAWYVSERLPGRTLYDAWPAADSSTRQAMIESLGTALRALHRIPPPPDLLPPWLADAPSDDPTEPPSDEPAAKPSPAFHPPPTPKDSTKPPSQTSPAGCTTPTQSSSDALAW